ncbi:MAG: hypothetical protein Q8N87_01330 [bacterium]|nr:hypothetical protein [bacterium]
MNSTQTPLTKEQREKIWDVIHENMQPDDRYPCEVIRDKPFDDNEEKYLQTMACYHGIAL